MLKRKVVIKPGGLRPPQPPFLKGGEVSQGGSSLPEARPIKIIDKRGENTSYQLSHTHQKLIPVEHDPIKLPQTLHLVTFPYQNSIYWLEQDTHYLFIPGSDQTIDWSKGVVGQLQGDKVPLIPPSEEREETCAPPNSYPLSETQIKWFVRYELDVVAE